MTSDELREKIILLIYKELQNKESELYKTFYRVSLNKINSMILKDNDNDINWDELNEFFGQFNSQGFVHTSENNYYVSIDEANLEEGQQYSLKYINEFGDELTDYQTIITFTA